MKYEIKLYAHGVTNGQSTWGVENFDSSHIQTFYRGTGVSPQMFVETLQFGSSTYCYYTYMRTDNICDNNGRTGSYFAFTLRINYYYADIQNVYNLLDAAYNKFAVGTIIDINGVVSKYLIADFAQADNFLKKLESELINYLMQFSSDSDFVPLSGFKANGHKTAVININLLECGVRAIANHIKNNGSISVSPLHQSSREQSIIKEMNDKETKALKQIADVRQKAEQDIQAVKDEYKDVEQERNMLRSQNDKITKEKNNLMIQLDEAKSERKNAQTYKAQLETLQKTSDKNTKILADITKLVSESNGIYERHGTSHIQPTGYGEREHGERKHKGRLFGAMSFIKKIHPLTDFIVMAVLLGVIGGTLSKSYGNMNNSTQQTQQTQQNETDKTDTDSIAANTIQDSTTVK